MGTSNDNGAAFLTMSADELRASLAAVRSGDLDLNMQKRFMLAKAMVHAGVNDEAAEELAWLWDNMLGNDRAMHGVRSTFMANEMRDLAAEHPPAKERFIKLRDAAHAAFEGKAPDQDGTTALLDDWMVLNEIVADEERTLTWYDTAKESIAWESYFQRPSLHLEELLKKKNLYGEIARFVRRPIAKLREFHVLLQALLRHATPAHADEEQRSEFEALVKDRFRTSASYLHAGLLVSSRDEDAEQYTLKAIEMDDSAEMRCALVTQALKANQPRESQRELLNQAAAKGADVTALQAELESKLKK